MSWKDVQYQNGKFKTSEGGSGGALFIPYKYASIK